jgi:hypothetical protein
MTATGEACPPESWVSDVDVARGSLRVLVRDAGWLLDILSYREDRGLPLIYADLWRAKAWLPGFGAHVISAISGAGRITTPISRASSAWCAI